MLNGRERFLKLGSSFSPAWPSPGHGWKTRQPFSHKLLHSANQIEVLDKLLFSSCSDWGEKQPISHKQVQPEPSLRSCCEPEQAWRGPGRERRREGRRRGLDVNISIFLASSVQNLTDVRNSAACSQFCVSKNKLPLWENAWLLQNLCVWDTALCGKSLQTLWSLWKSDFNCIWHRYACTCMHIHTWHNFHRQCGCR